MSLMVTRRPPGSPSADGRATIEQQCLVALLGHFPRRVVDPFESSTVVGERDRIADAGDGEHDRGANGRQFRALDLEFDGWLEPVSRSIDFVERLFADLLPDTLLVGLTPMITRPPPPFANAQIVCNASRSSPVERLNSSVFDSPLAISLVRNGIIGAWARTTQDRSGSPTQCRAALQPRSEGSR